MHPWLPCRLQLSCSWLALLLVALTAGTGAAQTAPVVRLAVDSDPIPAGLLQIVRVEAVIAPDAPGDAVATLDPKGIGRNAFVRRLDKTTAGLASLTQCPDGRQCFDLDLTIDYYATPGEHALPITVTDSKGRSTTAGIPFRIDPFIDNDHDGLPDFWELEYNLNTLANDAAGDPDGDGVSNLDEFRAGTNPIEKYTRFYAEGSSGDRQPLVNCISVRALQEQSFSGHARVVYIGDEGRRADVTAFLRSTPVTPCPMDDRTVADRVVAIRVESDVPFAAERDTVSGYARGTPYPSRQLVNASPGVQEPARAWVFADGHTADGIDMFLLLYNPASAPVDVEFTYVRAPATVLARKTRVLPPGIRTTVWVNQDDPEVLPTDVSVLINAAEPILAERAYRYQSPGRTVPHDSVSRGAWVSSTQWYFPDVDSRGPFQSSIVLVNPGPAPATVTAMFTFTDREATSTRATLVSGERRVLSWPDIPVPNGVAYGVSLTSTTGIVAERVSSGATASGGWRRAAIGAMQPGVHWVFVNSGGMYGQEGTDLVITNPSSKAAHVTVHMRALGFDSEDNAEGTVDVPAGANLRVPIGAGDPARTIPVLPSGTITVDSDTPIVVERTTYWDQDGVRHGRAASLIGNQQQ